MLAALTGTVWLDCLIGSAAGLTALGTIWRKGLRPFLHACRTIADYGATLTEIAQEFKPNHGTSLKDQMTATQNAVADTRAVVDRHMGEAIAHNKRLEDFVLTFAEHSRQDLEAFDELRAGQHALLTLAQSPLHGEVKLLPQSEETA